MKQTPSTQRRISFLAKFIVGPAIAFGPYLMPSPASACCSVTTGTVKSIGYLPNGIFFFSLNGATNSPPSCNSQKRFALNTNISTQKNLMALLLASQASGTTLQVVGLQTCNTWPDSEDIGAVNSM
jgi:hypothetical protein